MHIGERLKKVRQELKFSQKEFSSFFGLSQNIISRYELGNSEISNAVIDKLVNEFGVNANWLITGRGEMFGDGAAARGVDPKIIEKLIESAKSNTAIKTLWLKALEADNEEERRSYIDALATLLNNIGNALK